MRQILLFGVVMAALGIGFVQYADKIAAGPGAAPVNAVQPAPAVADSPAVSFGYRSVTLQSDGRGHFQADANVDGQRIDFLVDTGASMVVLRESAAARLGIRPQQRDYTVRTQTANGEGRAARIRLGRVELSNIAVRDVEAFVVPDEQLAVNLLGMSFLSRLKWTHDRGRLVLEQ